MTEKAILIGGMLLIIAVLFNYAALRSHRAAARFIERSKGIEGLISALDALGEWEDPSLAIAGGRALIHSLKTLSGEELTQLDSKNRRRLSSLLRHEVSDSTMILILRALEVLCDRESEDDVQWISHSGRTIEVRRAAFKCLEVMRKRWEENASKELLLRPSGEFSQSLRPAAGINADSVETLLRPLESAKDSDNNSADVG